MPDHVHKVNIATSVERREALRPVLEAALDHAYGVYTSELVGGMGGLGRGRSGRPPGSSSVWPSAGWLLGVDGTRQARMKPTD